MTIAKPPSVWDGMTRLIEMFLPTMEAKYFCKWGWTALSTNRPTGKSLEPLLLLVLSFHVDESCEAHLYKVQLMGIAEFIIGRAFA